MTYNQCAAIGAMIKANKAAQQRAQNAEQNRLQFLADFQKNLQNVHQKILDLASAISKSTPAIISKPLNFVLTQIIGRFVQIISNIPTIIINISQKIIDIADKLNLELRRGNEVKIFSCCRSRKSRNARNNSISACNFLYLEQTIQMMKRKKLMKQRKFLT